MGVLEPLESKAQEAHDHTESDDIKQLVNSITYYGPAFIQDEDTHDRLEEELGIEVDVIFKYIEEFFDKSREDIDSIEEVNRIAASLNQRRNEVEVMKSASGKAAKYARMLDVEPDYQNPVDSALELLKLRGRIENIPANINDKTGRELSIDHNDYGGMKAYFSGAYGVDALPIIEGVAESMERIDEEIESLMDSTRDEYSPNSGTHNPPEIPKDPIEWSEVLDTDRLPRNLGSYISVEDLPGVTYGDTLHLRMEELLGDAEEIDGFTEDILAEEPLAFTNPERPPEKTPQPDVMDDMFVYDFKYLPQEEVRNLETHGDVNRNHPKFVENINQMNWYLNDLDLQAGILVYVDQEFNVTEYVVERHEGDLLEPYRQRYNRENFDQEFVHRRSEYDFSDIP